MNSHYTKKAFENCQFNPFNPEKMMQAYPIITEIVQPEWSDDPNLDMIIRYTIAVYDPKSPLSISEKDLNYRKGSAMEMLDIEDDAFKEALYLCTYPMLVELTVKYLCRFIRSKEWAAIAAIEFKYWEAIKLIMQPISSDKSDREQLDAANKKDVLSASIDEGLTKLDLYYRRFFGEDEELLNKAKRRLTPELMAGKVA
jgi:hypothetical protein